MDNGRNIQDKEGKEIRKLREALIKLDRAKEELNQIAEDLLKVQHKFELFLFNTSRKTFI